MKLIPILAALAAISLSSCKKEEIAKSAAVSTEYPLTTCVVSGENLGSMGEAIVYDHEGTTVKFCCDKCIPKFKKDPATYLAKLKK